MISAANLLARLRYEANELGFDYDPHVLISLEIEAMQVNIETAAEPLPLETIERYIERMEDLNRLRADLIERGILPLDE